MSLHLVPPIPVRRFRVTRVLELDVEFSADELEEETPEDNAISLAGGYPEHDWTMVNQEVEEL